MSAPATTHAIVIQGQGKFGIEEVPTPRLRDDYILIKTSAVSLNPTDWKSADTDDAGLRSGCDYVGVVVQVGKNVTKDFKPGDRIAGFIQGANKNEPEDGAFAGYVVAKGDIQFKVPDHWSDEDAATLGVGIITCSQGLYQTMKLPLPNDAAGIKASAGTPILIYGGSTATGVLGIQFARLSGLRVLATSSPRNFDYLRSLGADEVFDYRSPGWAEAVRESTGGRLRHAWDCISDGDSSKGCAAALDADPAAGAQYACLLPVDADAIRAVNPGVDGPKMTLGYTVMGEAVCRYGEFPAMPDHFEHGKMFAAVADGLLAEGKLRAIKTDVDRGGRGLEGVLVGIQELKAGKVSATKLVYHV